MTGRLLGIGVGPGDPELLTLRAARRVREAHVVAHLAARDREGNALAVVADLLRPDQWVVRLTYPVTIEDVPAAEYERLLGAFYDGAAETIAAHLDAGHDVALLCEGDPLFYGSFMYLYHRLRRGYATEIVPGVTSVAAAAAASGVALAAMNESLTFMSGVRPAEDLAEELAACDAAVILKVGRNLDRVRAAVEKAGRAEGAVYVERASATDQRVLPLADTDGMCAPYFSVVLVPGSTATAR